VRTKRSRPTSSTRHNQVILANPKDIAAAIDPEAAKHNATTFYHREASGRLDRSKPLTVGELEDLANQRMGGGSQILAHGGTSQDEFNVRIAELITALQDAAKAFGYIFVDLDDAAATITEDANGAHLTTLALARQVSRSTSLTGTHRQPRHSHMRRRSAPRTIGLTT
jgi:hypothetical protein